MRIKNFLILRPKALKNEKSEAKKDYKNTESHKVVYIILAILFNLRVSSLSNV